jgi:hypothetical protein
LKKNNNQRPNIIQSASPVKEFVENNRKSSDSRSYNSNLYSNNNIDSHNINSSKESAVSISNRPSSRGYSRPTSAQSITKENNLINSDSDGDIRQSNNKINKQLLPASSPSNSGINDRISNRMSENSPQRVHKQTSNSPNSRQRRSVRISSVVSDIENDEHIQLVDRSSDPNANLNDNSSKQNGMNKARVSNGNDSNINYNRVYSSSIDSSEKRDNHNQEPKVYHVIN